MACTFLMISILMCGGCDLESGTLWEFGMAWFSMLLVLRSSSSSESLEFPAACGPGKRKARSLPPAVALGLRARGPLAHTLRCRPLSLQPPALSHIEVVRARWQQRQLSLSSPPPPPRRAPQSPALNYWFSTHRQKKKYKKTKTKKDGLKKTWSKKKNASEKKEGEKGDEK